MIIDVHTHLGFDHCYGTDNPEAEFLYYQDLCKIDHAIIQPAVPLSHIEENAAIHDKIYDFCKQHNGRFFGMASISPHFRPEVYEKELVRCVKELGFLGVKITPAGHGINPAIKDIHYIYEICRDLDIPVMIHTGSGTPFADAINIYDIAKKFKDVKFIIAHAGGEACHGSAIHVAKLCENVYLEPSWLMILSLLGDIKAIGAERIMFSTDLALNAPVEIAKYNALPITEEEREWLFCKTAKSVFKLNV